MKWIEGLSDELTNPWDWVALAAGAAIGFAFGHRVGLPTDAALGTGATAAVVVRKAGAALLCRPVLRWRARRLDDVLRAIGPHSKHEELEGRLEQDIVLFQQRVITNDQFASFLTGHVTKYRE